jgi:hypothetical protein
MNTDIPEPVPLTIAEQYAVTLLKKRTLFIYSLNYL